MTRITRRYSLLESLRQLVEVLPKVFGRRVILTFYLSTELLMGHLFTCKVTKVSTSKSQCSEPTLSGYSGILRSIGT